MKKITQIRVTVFLLFALPQSGWSMINNNCSNDLSTGTTTGDTIKIVKKMNRLGVIKKGQTIILSGRQKNQGDQTTIEFMVTTGKIIHGEIITKKGDANLRFNQFDNPEGTGDGPYGNTIDIDIKKTGTFKLILAESLMADAWRGKFVVKISVR